MKFPIGAYNHWKSQGDYTDDCEVCMKWVNWLLRQDKTTHYDNLPKD